MESYCNIQSRTTYGERLLLRGETKKEAPPTPSSRPVLGAENKLFRGLKKKKKKIKREGGQVWKSCGILSRVEKIFYVTGQRWLPTQHSPLYSLP